MKEALIAKFLGNIGALDGVVETGLLGSCKKSDSLSVGISSGSSLVSFVAGSFSKSTLGRIGGNILTTGVAAINVRRSGKLTASDLFAILGGVAGLLGITPAMAVFAVSGLAVTLYDGMKYKGSDGCVNPPHIPLGDLIPPGSGSPDMKPGENASCPLIIDMDGNGIKTISINKNVFFDLDNNLFAESTGWVDKGDAFLVWDRDNNGVIDSGNELFGNHTRLSSGKKAENGFAALAELDSNQDNIFDEKDEAWFKLQLWFDRNQNGISEAGELVKLSESGIKSINLSYNNTDHIDESGNHHRQRSSVSWKDGRKSEIADVWFDVNTAKAYSREEITISDEIKSMPNVIAFGNLLDLHSAMEKNKILKHVIQEYIDSNLEDRSYLINELVYEWAGVAQLASDSRGGYFDARKLAVLELLTGREFRQGNEPNPNRNSAAVLELEFKKFTDYVLAQIESKTIYKEVFSMDSFLINKNSGELEFDWSRFNNKVTELIKANNFIEANRILSIVNNLGAYNLNYLQVVNKNLEYLSSNNKEVASLIHSNVITGTSINDILVGSDQDDVFIASRGKDTLEGKLGADTYIFAKGHGQDVITEYDTYQSGKRDTLRFTDVNYNDVRFRRENDDLILFGYHGNDRITIRNFYYDDYYQIENFQFADRTLSLSELKTIGMPLMGTHGDDEIQDWDSNAVIHGGDGNDRIYAHDGDDTLIGGKGNDVLDGSYGADTYIFAKGHGQDVISEYDTYQSGKQDTLRFTDVNYNDVRFRRENDDLILFGYHGNDRITIQNFYNNDYYQIENFQFADRTLSLEDMRREGINFVGTEGDDELTDAHDENEVSFFTGGKGNDVLDGSYGADTYIFAKGHGQDVISEYDTYQSGKQDTLRFTDVNYNDVRFRRENDDLILFGYHGNDRITIQNFYNNDYYQIENFQFADRTLSLEDMRREGINFVGTEGDDELTDAHDENEVSFFTGGKGNDVLDGSYGADTYIFAKGHGQDIISEYDTYQSGKQDTLRFTDVNYNDVRFRRENDDLILFGYHGNDRITIRNFYYDDYYQIENFQFADRTLSLSELKTIGMPLMGTHGDDEIQDWDSNAVIHGGDGNDRIYARDGDDTLIGGKGNDVLDGSYGADTYIFAKGHGQDVISEYDTYQSGKQDRILFEHINRPDELWFSRQGDDLTIKEWHGKESLTIKDWYAHEYYQVEQIQLADGKSLNLSQLDKLIEAMAGFEREHSGDITRMPSNEVQTYLDKIAVSSYWG